MTLQVSAKPLEQIDHRTISTSRQQTQMEFELLTAAGFSTFDLKA